MQFKATGECKGFKRMKNGESYEGKGGNKSQYVCLVKKSNFITKLKDVVLEYFPASVMNIFKLYVLKVPIIYLYMYIRKLKSKFSFYSMRIFFLRVAYDVILIFPYCFYSIDTNEKKN